MGDFLMNKNILSLFIKTLNVDSSFRYLNYFGYNFTRQEIELLLPYLKENVDKLDKNNKIDFFTNIPPVSTYCKNQLSKLFDQFIN